MKIRIIKAKGRRGLRETEYIIIMKNHFDLKLKDFAYPGDKLLLDKTFEAPEWFSKLPLGITLKAN